MGTLKDQTNCRQGWLVRTLAAASLCTGNAHAAVNTFFQGNTLQATSDAADAIVLTTDGTNVKVNGADPDNLNDPGMPVAADAIVRIVLTAGPLGSTLDASGFPGAATPSPSLFPIEMNGGDGVDTIIGSPGRDQVIGGLGNDSITTGDENDSFVWFFGDGTDTIDLGSGSFDRARFDGPGDALMSLNAVFEDNGSGVARFRQTDGAMVTIPVLGVEELSFLGGPGADSLTVTDLSSTSVTDVEFEGRGGDDTLDASLSNTPVRADHGFAAGNDTLVASQSDNDSLSISPGTSDINDTYTISETASVLKIDGAGSSTFTLEASGFESMSLGTRGGNDMVTVQELANSDLTFLSVFADSGDDTVSVTPSSTVEMNLNGSSEDTADTLIYDALQLPLETNGNTRTTQGRQPVLANDFETIQILNPQPRSGDQWEF